MLWFSGIQGTMGLSPGFACIHGLTGLSGPSESGRQQIGPCRVRKSDDAGPGTSTWKLRYGKTDGRGTALQRIRALCRKPPKQVPLWYPSTEYVQEVNHGVRSSSFQKCSFIEMEENNYGRL